MLGLVGVMAGMCTLASPAHAAVKPADRAATHTLLQATYTLALTLVNDTAKANAAIGQAGAVIAAECPGVLAGAPGGTGSFSTASVGKTAPSPRLRGEMERRQRQYTTLTDELETALRSASYGVEATALASFEATVTPLRWSNPAVAKAVKLEISLFRVIFQPGPAPPAVCADMRSWVAGGYRTLSAGSRAFVAQQEDSLTSLPLHGATSSEALVKPYEGPRERAILRRREALSNVSIFEIGGPAALKLDKELGIEGAGEQAPGSAPKSRVVGHGITHTGAKFKVEVNKGPGAGCRDVIAFSVTLSSEGGTVTSSSSSSLRCLSGGKSAAHPSVSCDEGLLEVESTTLAPTRRVRLALSDGRSITSSVTPISRRYGGPAGAYFQTLRGPSPYPVSLSELGAKGEVLRSVRLRAPRGCRRNPAGKPLFKQLVQGTTPDGLKFSITAFSNEERGQRRLNFEAQGPIFQNSTTEAPSTGSPAAAKYFSTRLTMICEPHPYDIVYGQLKAPGDTVLVATARTPLTALTPVAIPESFHAKGVLAYAALGGLATELVVRSASGQTLAREDLTSHSKSDGEYCEGYAEPAA